MVNEKEQHVRVGTGVWICKDGKVLLGKRKGDLAGGEYANPGGHFEYMESLEQSIRREIREETGIEVENIRFAFLQNVKEYAPKHYVGINFIADWKSGEPTVMEPEKCERWDWYALDAFPELLFVTGKAFLEMQKTGKNFFDA